MSNWDFERIGPDWRLNERGGERTISVFSDGESHWTAVLFGPDYKETLVDMPGTDAEGILLRLVDMGTLSEDYAAAMLGN